MSRYSLPWDRTGAAAADTTSKKSLASTRKSTAAFFYPPITPPPTSSNQAMSEPLVPPSPRTPPPLPPHPYQTYAAGSYTTTPHSQTQLTPGRYPNTISTGSSTDGDADKASHNTIQPTYVIHHHHHHHHSPAHTDSRRLPPQPQPAAPPPRTSPPIPRLRKSRPLLLLILFLPLPPLLSVLYLLVGHKILVHASPSPSPTPSLLSSASAAATGGSILSLPLYLLLYLLLVPAPSHSSTGASPPRTAHEDFFDDSDSHTPTRRTLTTTLATYAACGVLVLGVGGAAGALGVTCLAREGVGMLGPGKAAEAGIVGGLVLWAGVLVVCAVGAGGWWVLSLSLGLGRGRRVREDGLGKG